MLKLKPLPVSPESQLRQLGWDWMLGVDTLPYITHDVVLVRKDEAEAYARAANDLYDMFVDAGQHVLDNNLFSQLNIPSNLIELIRLSWDDDRHLHLYGRFDLAGGLEGKPVKLIEFNADTPTCVPETAVVQWAHLQANGLRDSMQFNAVFETLVINFRRLRGTNDDLEPTLLLSALRDAPEDDTNVAVIGEAAKEAGFEVTYRYVDEVDFSPEEGIFTEEDGRFYRHNFWFKLIPWEYIAQDEPQLAEVLTQIVRRRRAVIVNPAYTLLFQSKAILKVLWELYPYHPLLLETGDKPLSGKASVEKVLFGREGANVRMLDASGNVLREKSGEYGQQPKVYQEYTELLQDYQGNSYQAGVFFAYEACGLGFRRGEPIITNTAQFTGHVVD